MRSRRHRTFGILAVAALAVVLPALVLAATTQQLVTLATNTYAMNCVPSVADQTCDRAVSASLGWRAVIQPASGQETNLVTRATRVGTIPGTGLDGPSRFMPGHAVYRWNRLG